MRAVWFIAALAIELTATLCSAEPRREPYFGRYGTTCAMPAVSGALLVSGKKSPVGKSEAALVDRFIAAVKYGKSAENLLDRVRIPAQTLASCSAVIAKVDAMPGCARGAHYMLGDGEIRAEWACEKKIIYFAFFTISDNKITNIWSDGNFPILPIFVPSTTSKPNG